MKFILIVVLFLTFYSCKKGKNNPEACNGSSTRREVKLGTDDKASLINMTPIVISVEDIGVLSVPEVDKKDDRQNVEQQVYTITAVVHKLSKHRDGDWKVKLTNGNDKYINCEVPNPGCEYAKRSSFIDKFKEVRSWIENEKEAMVGKVVTVTGIGFIDIDHKYPRNAAENEMELHPILEISY